MPGKIEGTIVAFSSDGNLVSDIPNSSLAGAPRGENVLIACDEHETIGLFEPGHGQPDMTLLALLGESGFLELTIVSDSAKIMLGVSRGTPIVVKWQFSRSSVPPVLPEIFDAPASPPGKNSPSMGDLLAWDKTHLWHAFTQMAEYESLIVTRAQGCWLETIDGRRLLDGVSSLWCNVHGHRHPRIGAAIKAQLDEVAHVTLLGMSAPVTIRLARRLAEISPAGLEHVFFSDSGASAVEVALKMAFQYWRQKPNPEPQRTKYLALDNAYHGDTLGSVSVGGVARFHQMFEPLLFDVLRLPQPSVDHLPAGIARGDACDYYLQQFDAALALHGHELAAVVIEPLVQCAAGMIMHPPGYLRGIRQLCTKHGVLLIADEVAVGMGRTGTMFACEQEQVSPDFLCLAKGITGGYLPLAATLTTTEIWNAFLGTYAESKTFFHGHTYGGNPLGAAAAMATLDVFEQEQTLVQLQDKIARLSKHLARLAEHPHVGSVRQCGLIAGVELVRDKATGQPFAWEEKRGFRVCAEAMRHGVWIRPLGSDVVLMPPLAVSPDELDLLCAAVEQGILVATGTSAGS